jgi:cytochrome c-type biogenesis protein CcmH
MAECWMRFAHLTAAVVSFTLALCSPALVWAQTEASSSEIAQKVPGAERLEGRLLAPCCWTQTLDIHGSEIANALRREIRTRLKVGEAPEAIEQSLVARYGERIRAVPDRVPLNTMGTLGWLAVAASAVFLAYVLRKWRKRSLTGHGNVEVASGAALDSGEATDERLESELRRLHDT